MCIIIVEKSPYSSIRVSSHSNNLDRQISLLLCYVIFIYVAYTALQRALVSHEVANIPRGVLHTRSARTANPNKALAAIPECIQSRYDRNPPPELRPALTGEGGLDR